MLDLVIHSDQTAPKAARAGLVATKKLYGFIPNLTGAMAEAPAVLDGYLDLGNAFVSSSFSPVEREVITLTTSFYNGCVYCMSGHSMLASMAGMSEADLEALRRGEAMPDAHLEALHSFTRKLLGAGGAVSAADLDAFLAAGYTRQQAMEVPLGIAFKTLSNYTHRLQPVPVDQPVESFFWTAPPKRSRSRFLVAGWLRETGEDALTRYQAAAGPIMVRHGGKPLLKSKPTVAHAGTVPDLVVLLEFPSSEAGAAAFADPEYTKLIPLRDEAFARLEVADLGPEE